MAETPMRQICSPVNALEQQKVSVDWAPKWAHRRAQSSKKSGPPEGGWRAAEWPSMDTAVQGGDDRLAGLNFFRLDFVEPRQVCLRHG